MRKKSIHFLSIILMVSVLMSVVWAADGKVQNPKNSLGKTTGVEDRKSGIMDGNLILTLFYNFGGIGNWGIAGRLNSGIYPKGSGRSYFAEFTPVIGAECYNAHGIPIHIFSDGIVVDSRNQMDKDENGRQLGFDPVPGYANPLQDKIAMSDDPESWPYTWPDRDESWNGFWNGQYGKYVRGDLETYFVMNDYGNDEFPYYPISHPDYAHLNANLRVVSTDLKTLELTAPTAIFDPLSIRTFGKRDVVKIYRGLEKNARYYEIVSLGDLNEAGKTNVLVLNGIFNSSRLEDLDNAEYSIMKASRRGLGFQVDVRGYQWAHPAAEDLIIWTYWINNTSDNDYNKTVFAMYGDADVGDDGDQHDDAAWFDRPNSIVYQWDINLWSNVKGGFKPAYFGWRFLESPGNPLDGIDNDYDGMVDESQSDGIDNDGDWDPDLDDKGSDGIGPKDDSYPGPDWDGTEGNGLPDKGEPNFEYVDNDESDQIGLTSFSAQAWPGILCSNDEGVWGQTLPDFFGAIDQNVDLTFLYGSGYFLLPSVKNDSLNSQRKFSVAMVLGEDQKDILRNATVIQQIYNADYAFAKPPRKPKVWAVPGDHKVTLYWNRVAELSVDHIYGEDFEGYRIYKATDPNFIESRLISDAYGNLTFNKPLAQFDLDDGLTGLHPIDYNGVKFDMGEDTGLQYSFIDHDVQNGQTYYYAVCSYDKGYAQGFYAKGWAENDSLPPMQPSECTKRLFTNVQGQVIATDDNTVVAVPNAPTAGYIAPSITDVDSSRFIGTGQVSVDFVDPLLIPDGSTFEIHFQDEGTDGIDNDGDWRPWDDKPDGIWNSGEFYRDWGLDDTPDSLENGYQPRYNPDPVHDNYNKFTNHCDRFDNDGDGLIDSMDVKIITQIVTVIDTTETPPDTTYFTFADTLLDDWGTENNDLIDWIDSNTDGIYQKTEKGERFTDIGNGIRDNGEKLLHDIGADGLGPGDSGYPGPDPDGSENNGKPDLGEPNLDYRDNEERARRTTCYSMIDYTDPADPDTVIKDSPWINGEVYNDFVHGMHVFVESSPIAVIEDASRWANPTNIFAPSTKLYVEGVGGIPYPHDYQIIITDSVQFSSFNNKVSNFYVYDETEADTVDFVYFPKNKSGILTLGDKVLPVLDNYDVNTSSTIKGTWLVTMETKLSNVKQVLKDSQGRLWAVSSGAVGYFGYYDGAKWLQVQGDLIDGLLVKCLAEYVDGDLWIGTDDGIYTFNGEDFAAAPIDTYAVADLNIKSILVDSNGSVWLGSTSGLTHYMGPENYEFFTQQDTQFNSYDISALLQDAEGSIWVGTSDGIGKIKNGTVTVYPSTELPNKIVRGIYESSLGIMVATSSGVSVLPTGQSEWTKLTGSLLVNSKVNCFADFNDSLWIGTEKGLSVFGIADGLPTSAEQVRHINLTDNPDLIRSENIQALFVNGNRLWLGNHQGFDYYENGHWDTFAPKSGDIYSLKISKPFSSDDVFEFRTLGAKVDDGKAREELKDIAVVPNPYIAAVSWEPAHLYTSGRGTRKIDFIHLPQKCTIKIFTLRGYLVQTLEHDSTIDNGAESWDLTSKDGLDVAYGVYIYHVEAPGIGTRVGKFAVIK